MAEIADRLCAEFGYREEAPLPNEASLGLFGGFLDPEDERLIATARHSLARIAAAVGAGHSDSVQDRTARLLLDGAEMVMRAELIRGKSVVEAMPDFVFLVVLPVVDQDEAIELSRRTASLLAEAMT